MEDTTTFFKKDTSAIKNSKHMKRNVFVIYSPRHIKIEPENFRRTGTEISVFLPQKSNGFIRSRLNGDELKELFHGEHHLWIEILNRSFVDNIAVKRNKPLGFLVVEPENLNFKYAPTKKENKTKKEVVARSKRKRQLGWVSFQV